MNNSILAKIISQDLRDSAIDHVLNIESGSLKSPRSMSLNKKYANIPEDHKEVFRELFVDALDTGIHDFLYSMQKLHDESVPAGWVEDGEFIAARSDGLQGEIFGDDGWFSIHSKHQLG